MKKAKVSMRARKYVKNKISGMSNTKAAISAGYSKNTAKLAATNIENHSVTELMEDLMDKEGLTDIRLVQDLKEGLHEANRIFGSGDNFVETPDYGVRHRYLDTALKLKGKMIDQSNLNLSGKGVLVIPSELIEKYGITPDSKTSSK